MSGLPQWPLSEHRRAADFLAVIDVSGTPREARGLDVCLGEKEGGGREREEGRKKREKERREEGEEERRKGREKGEGRRKGEIMLFVLTCIFHWCTVYICQTRIFVSE